MRTKGPPHRTKVSGYEVGHREWQWASRPCPGVRWSLRAQLPPLEDTPTAAARQFLVHAPAGDRETTFIRQRT